MKKITLILTIFALCCTQIKAQDFSAKRFVQSASITLNGNIDRVFPLFGAMEEKKWEPSWNPTILFSQSGNMEKGMVFKTPDHIHAAPPVTWVVTEYDVKTHQLVYCLTSPIRVAVITINCSSLGANSTKVEISYQLTGLTEDGNELSHHMITKVFATNLKDWEAAINGYLATAH